MPAPALELNNPNVDQDARALQYIYAAAMHVVRRLHWINVCEQSFGLREKIFRKVLARLIDHEEGATVVKKPVKKTVAKAARVTEDRTIPVWLQATKAFYKKLN